MFRIEPARNGFLALICVLGEVRGVISPDESGQRAASAFVYFSGIRADFSPQVSMNSKPHSDLLSRKPAPSIGRRGVFCRFARDERGVTAILFALLLIPMLGIIFVAMDYGRASRTKVVLESAADAAAFTAATRLLEGKKVVRQAFEASFRANLPEDLKTIPYDLEIGTSDKFLKVSMVAKIPTTMIGLLGMTKIEMTVEAEASRPEPAAVPVPELPPALEEFENKLPPGLREEMQRKLSAAGASREVLDRLPSEDELRRQLDNARRQLEGLRFHLR